MAPIKGRLLASRLPPQPSTHHKRPPRCSGQWAKRLQRFAHGVRRVGVVHRRQRLVHAAHALHAPGNRGQVAANFSGSGQRHTQRAHGTNHAQQVGHVVSPNEAGLQGVAFCGAVCQRLDQSKAQSLGVVADVDAPASAPGRHTRWSRSTATCPPRLAANSAPWTSSTLITAACKPGQAKSWALACQ